MATQSIRAVTSTARFEKSCAPRLDYLLRRTSRKSNSGNAKKEYQHRVYQGSEAARRTCTPVFRSSISNSPRSIVIRSTPRMRSGAQASANATLKDVF